MVLRAGLPWAHTACLCAMPDRVHGHVKAVLGPLCGRHLVCDAVVHVIHSVRMFHIRSAHCCATHTAAHVNAIFVTLQFQVRSAAQHKLVVHPGKSHELNSSRQSAQAFASCWPDTVYTTRTHRLWERRAASVGRSVDAPPSTCNTALHHGTQGALLVHDAGHN